MDNEFGLKNCGLKKRLAEKRPPLEKSKRHRQKKPCSARLKSPKFFLGTGMPQYLRNLGKGDKCGGVNGVN